MSNGTQIQLSLATSAFLLSCSTSPASDAPPKAASVEPVQKQTAVAPAPDALQLKDDGFAQLPCAGAGEGLWPAN